MSDGLLIAIIGAALAAILPGIGSAIGVQMGGKAAAGVVAEKPELFGKLLILQALPGTQGIYGFLIAILLMVQTGMLGGGAAQLTTAQGWSYFGACMPITIVGLISAIYQARTAVSAIHMVAKQPDASAKGMTMVALVETYAILALLASILILTGL
ncbi:MAG TPA: V-type ATP synthase subunit K [Bacilli bacterium]|nr:MAG: V-type sodium ATPase subunit K [Tenericutes bacterium ADurb.BinA124]HNZ50608.1 V-type ATP synthase subunit K [Bacilli bacterium]HPN60776.1 V-type ATP synthase subunit K [Bacilli bacterium]HPX84437.1 V-type ATP synthase subunit K [Bacilli bacterium]HQC74386.1 V-type ATP synthase subunit K [Bacilli bacterium]